MEYINFSGPINSLSFGNVAFNMLRELHQLDQKVCFFPIGNKLDLSAFDKASDDLKKWITSSYNERLSNLSRDNPSLKMWHLNSSEARVGSHAENCFKSSSCENTKYIPIGLDPDIHDTGKVYLKGKVSFGLVGKFEKRKHTSRILKLWAEKYGNNNEYQLTCCINNPFFKEDQMKAAISNALDHKTYTNINFLPYLKTNSEMNELYNAIDINLSGLSGAEGWNLPAFNSTCLGKWSIVLNATSHKDWANTNNSILVEPSGEEKIYDEVFFKEGQDFNQGNLNCFSDEDFNKATDKAVSLHGKSNSQGLELSKEFNYKNTVNKLLKLLKS
jgi:hypothetical protein